MDRHGKEFCPRCGEYRRLLELDAEDRSFVREREICAGCLKAAIRAYSRGVGRRGKLMADGVMKEAR